MLNGVMIPQRGSLFLSFSGTCRGWPIQHLSLSGHFCILLSLKWSWDYHSCGGP